jgi:hypothetical protein
VVPRWYYGGEDSNCNGKLDIDLSRGISEDVNGNGVLDTYACPLADALNPSFMQGEWTSGDKTYAYSGKLAATGGEVLYSLKVEDMSGRVPLINLQTEVLRSLNSDLTVPIPSLADEEKHPPRPGTERMVYTLVQLLRQTHPKLPWERVPQCINDVTAKGNFTQRELEASLPPEIAVLLMPLVTAYGWADPTTIKPPYSQNDIVPPEAAPENLLPQWQAGNTPTLTKPIRYERIALEPRAAVNINTAPMEVLVACLNGLKARVVRPGFVNNDEDKSKLELLANDETYLKSQKTLADKAFTNYLTGNTEPFASLKNQWDRLEYVSIALSTAKTVAQKIITQRLHKAFLSWQDVAQFLRTLIVDNSLTPEQAALVWANANPNANLNGYNCDFPNSYLYPLWTTTGDTPKRLFHRIDKSDLITYTTEFCFQPTGYFEIASLSRLVAGNAITATTPEKTVIVQLFDQHKLSSQRDLENGMLSAQSTATCTYPEIAAKAAQFRADGYLSLAPLDTAAKGTAFSKPLPQWDTAGYQMRDGVFADIGNVIADAQARLTVKDKKSTNMLCFWYKPNWDILDTWARPHSLIDANVAGQDELFQVHNESRMLCPLGDNQARLTLFVWDKEAVGKPEPIKLTLIMPSGIERNRWLFFALYWNKGKVGMEVNEKIEEVWRRVSIFELMLFEPGSIYVPGTNQKVCMLYFIGENSSLKIEEAPYATIHYLGCTQHDDWYESAGNALVRLLPINLKYGISMYDSNRSTSKVDQDLLWVSYLSKNLPLGYTFANGISMQEVSGWNAFLTDTGTAVTLPYSITKKSYFQYLWQLYENAQESYSGNSEKQPVATNSAEQKVRAIIAQYLQGKSAVCSSERQWELKDNPQLQEYLALNIIPNSLSYELGGQVQYRRPNPNPLAPPEKVLLTCPSNGTYANLQFFNDLANPDAATSLTKQIYQAGRYQQQDATYAGTLQLPATASGNVHLGGLRWTEYRPQDCVDFADRGDVAQGSISISLHDAQGRTLAGPFTQAAANGVDLPMSSRLFWQASFTCTPGRPVVSASMLDDLTVTYSTGVRYVEWR